MNLKPFVNDKHLYHDFQQELDERIAKKRTNLEQVTTMEEVYRAQGYIKALRDLKMLREKVNG